MTSTKFVLLSPASSKAAIYFRRGFIDRIYTMQHVIALAIVNTLFVPKLETLNSTIC